MFNNSLFSSQSMEWATPLDFFNVLDQEFHFTLDPCASRFNAKCKKYFTIYDDGLSKDWGGEVVFCNPPYGKHIKLWVKKCLYESYKPNTIVVLLIPARTDTSYFHKYILHRCEIRFISGRLKFNNSKSAPFPSMLCIFRSGGILV